jgi:type I restriction enzyme M protein
MLDNETKRRIDSARDILVGKVPDPKSQVEQITVAMIYKFMDDMDLEAIELGGEPSFFTNEYSKYAWRELLKPSMSGTERLLMYSEAIVQMNLNPNLPQLFRDIFKNAYLPYRDPETLTLFLKTINDFKYDHSERLGDAFEYLLSVLGSQGDAGQFRTPRHIIDFMAAVIQPQKHEMIGDPACGTAGFLIASYKHILAENKGQLTPDERITLSKNLIGYDISPDMVRLSLVNLYLHGFRTPNVYEYDSLTSQERWGDYFDVILANPPFMSPKGGITPHNRFGVKSNRSEVLFVDYIAEHLKPEGRAAIIVPEGIIFQSGTAYKTLRKMLVDGYLYAVVSLPAGIFQPYSGVKTSILLMDKTLAKKSDNILFVKISGDGYDLGAQRRANTNSDLPHALDVLNDYKTALHQNRAFESDSSLCAVVSKEDIAKNGDYNFSADRYKVQNTEGVSKFEMVKLGDVCNIIGGGTPSKENEDYWNNGTVKWISAKYINNHGQVTGFDLITEQALKSSSSKISPKGSTILITRVSVGKIAFADEEYAINQDLTGLITKDSSKLDERFLFQVSKELSKIIEKNAQGIGVKGVTRKFVEDLPIPLPPLNIQQEIVSKIESYQRIIDGAKQVVNNYKPMIEVDKDWELVTLEEICELNPLKSELKNIDENTEVSFVPMADLNENNIHFKPKETRTLKEVIKNSYTYFKNNDILVAKVTPCFENGKSGVAQNLMNNIGFGSSEYYVLRTNEKKVLPQWVYYHISSDFFIVQGKLSMTGTGGLQRMSKDFVRNFKISLPPINIQAEIVAQIEREQSLVDANKALIGLMEAKIAAAIGKVWQQ